LRAQFETLVAEDDGCVVQLKLAVLADAQKKLDKLLANHNTSRAEIEALLKKLGPQEK
jgi:hypothetical protein